MTIPDHTPLLLNSTDHGLPLRTRTDLIVTEIPFDGQPTYVVKDPLSLRYHRLQPVQHFLLSLMAEGRTFDELQERLNEFEPAAYFEMRDVQRMLVDLHEKGLLVSQRPGQGTQLWQMRQKERRREWWQSCKSFLFLRFPGWSPERMLDGLEPVRRLLLHPLSLALQTMVIFASLLLVVREQAEFQSRLPGFQQFFQAGNLPYLWLSVILAKIVHQDTPHTISLALAAEYHSIGIGLH